MDAQEDFRYVDDPLLEAAVRGDPGAWRILVEHCRPMVLATVQSLGLERSDIDEMYQSLWLSLVAHIADIEREEDLAPWLRATAHHALGSRAWKGLRSDQADPWEPA
jgi:DNA-directed RNA polymerase specialized sigma24 family protein